MSTTTEAIEKREIGHFENLSVYEVDEDQLRTDVEITEENSGQDYKPGRTNARAFVRVRAAVELPPEVFRDLDTTGGSAHSQLGRSFSRDHESHIVHGGSGRHEGVSFKGIAKDDVTSRREKTERVLESIDTDDVRKDLRRAAVNDVVGRIMSAVQAFNRRTRKLFVNSLSNVDGWTDDDMTTEEADARSQAEVLKQKIEELEEQRRAAIETAHEAKKERVRESILEAKEDGTFGAAPAEWLDEAIARVGDSEPATHRGIFR